MGGQPGLDVDPEGCSISRNGGSGQVYRWAYSDEPLDHFPTPTAAPAADAKDVSPLRVWTIRIDRIDRAAIYMGFAKPSRDPAYDPNVDEMAVVVNTHDADVLLFAAVDGALQSAGMLSDLSRIIAQYSRPVRWCDSHRLRRTVSPEGCSVALATGLTAWSSTGRVWAVTDTALDGFPRPASASKASAVAVSSAGAESKATIRIDSAPEGVFAGICLPSGLPSYETEMDSSTASVGTHSPFVFHGRRALLRNVPHADWGVEAAGALYHFTADLSAGRVTVRPVLKTIRAGLWAVWTNGVGGGGGRAEFSRVSRDGRH